MTSFGRIGCFIATAAALTAACPAFAASATNASVSTAVNAWTVSFASELRLFSWESTRGYTNDVAPLHGNGKGTQIYVPTTFSLSGAINPDWNLSFVLRGGYVSAQQNTAGERGSVSTPVDTQTSATLTYNGINGIQPYVAMLVNFPTGESALYGSARFARMDSDLVAIGTYGEGLNIGPSIGANIPITQALMLTLSAGYTVRGPFDKEAADPVTGLITATDNVENGNEGTVSASLGYTKGPLLALGSISYSWDGISKVNEPGMFGFNEYRSGPRWMVSGNVTYNWTAHWSTGVNGFWVHSEKNDVLDSTRTYLIPEAFNSNSDVYQIGGSVTYTMANGLAIGPVASFLYRNHNAVDPATFSYTPAKKRWAAGVKATYQVDNTSTLTASLKRVWVDENELPGPPYFTPYIPALSGHAWQVTLGGTMIF